MIAIHSIRNIFEPIRWGMRGINHLLWPTICFGCRRRADELERLLCQACWQDLIASCGGDYCPACGRQASRFGLIAGRCGDCTGRELIFDGIARAGVYQGTLRRLILAMKFQDGGELILPLKNLLNAAFEAAVFYDQIDYWVPVPLHWRRRFSRGFNQARLLAGAMNHPSARISDDLVRIRNTPTQWSLDPAQRRRNVRGAFAVRDGHNFSNKRVCLVDDITTSNATINECSLTLKQAGATKVFVLVAAVAMQDRDE